MQLAVKMILQGKLSMHLYASQSDVEEFEK
jgi:hypothetical protein